MGRKYYDLLSDRDINNKKIFNHEKETIILYPSVQRRYHFCLCLQFQ